MRIDSQDFDCIAWSLYETTNDLSISFFIWITPLIVAKAFDFDCPLGKVTDNEGCRDHFPNFPEKWREKINKFGEDKKPKQLLDDLGWRFGEEGVRERFRDFMERFREMSEEEKAALKEEWEEWKVSREEFGLKEKIKNVSECKDVGWRHHFWGILWTMRNKMGTLPGKTNDSGKPGRPEYESWKTCMEARKVVWDEFKEFHENRIDGGGEQIVKLVEETNPDPIVVNVAPSGTNEKSASGSGGTIKIATGE